MVRPAGSGATEDYLAVHSRSMAHGGRGRIVKWEIPVKVLLRLAEADSNPAYPQIRAQLRTRLKKLVLPAIPG